MSGLLKAASTISFPCAVLAWGLCMRASCLLLLLLLFLAVLRMLALLQTSWCVLVHNNVRFHCIVMVRTCAVFVPVLFCDLEQRSCDQTCHAAVQHTSRLAKPARQLLQLFRSTGTQGSDMDEPVSGLPSCVLALRSCFQACSSSAWR